MSCLHFHSLTDSTSSTQSQRTAGRPSSSQQGQLAHPVVSVPIKISSSLLYDHDFLPSKIKRFLHFSPFKSFDLTNNINRFGFPNHFLLSVLSFRLAIGNVISLTFSGVTWFTWMQMTNFFKLLLVVGATLNNTTVCLACNWNYIPKIRWKEWKWIDGSDVTRVPQQSTCRIRATPHFR